MLDNSIDINRVSYFSDGKLLNATIWLRHGFNATRLSEIQDAVVSFGMLIDVNPNPGSADTAFKIVFYWFLRIA